MKSVTPLLGFIAGTAAVSINGAKVKAYTPSAFLAASPLVETSNTLSLTRRTSSRARFQHLRSLQTNNATVNGTYGVTTVIPLELASEYATNIQVGDTWFEVILDTGSSDTWLVESGFECVDVNMTAQPESSCYFGPLYNISSTFSQISDENFNITYGDGEFLTGILGYEKVTLANITVDRQEIGVVDYAYWEGDSVTSGLVGLAYAALTAAYNGTNPAADNPAVASDYDEYNPIFTTMYTDGKVAPLFTLILRRGNASSTLAIGGLPPSNTTYDEDDFTVTPIEIIELIEDPLAKTQYSFYTIYPDGFVYADASETTYSSGEWSTVFSKPVKHSQSHNGYKPTKRSNKARSTNDTITTDFPMIVDSGTTLLYLPTGLTNQILSLYEPSGYYSDYYGGDVVLCNATAPEFGVTINGTTFDINAADLILDEDFGDGICLTGIQDGSTGPYILGDVFLRNVIAVYDVGASEMKFAPQS